MPNSDSNSNKNQFSNLNNLGCLDALETRQTQLEGILGAIEASQDLNPKLLRACMWSASTLINESKAITARLSDFLPRGN